MRDRALHVRLTHAVHPRQSSASPLDSVVGRDKRHAADVQARPYAPRREARSSSPPATLAE
jgi:hypothetical protein